MRNRLHEQPDYVEARAEALADFEAGKEHGYNREVFLDRAMYTRIEANGIACLVPCWNAAEIEAALIMDGVTEYTVTIFDEHFEYETYRVWYEGTKRRHRETGHGSVVTVHLAPAGTLSDMD